MSDEPRTPMKSGRHFLSIHFADGDCITNCGENDERDVLLDAAEMTLDFLTLPVRKFRKKWQLQGPAIHNVVIHRLREAIEQAKECER